MRYRSRRVKAATASPPAPETPLERHLRLATTDAAMRPEFYRLLLGAEVLVLVETDREAPGSISAGEPLAIKCLVRPDGLSVIPFFTSPEAVFRANPGGGKCVLMRARALFEAKRDMLFHLNPYSEYGREFLPHEVDRLLRTGTLGFTAQESISRLEGVDIRDSRNAQPRMMDALEKLYARNTDVKKAYLAEVHDRQQKTVPWLLLVLDVASDVERIMRETATVVNDTLDGQCIVDIMQIADDSTSAVKVFCASVQPFYRAIEIPGSSARVGNLES